MRPSRLLYGHIMCLLGDVVSLNISPTDSGTCQVVVRCGFAVFFVVFRGFSAPNPNSPVSRGTKWRWVAAPGRTSQCRSDWWWIHGWCAAPRRRWFQWRALKERKKQGQGEQSTGKSQNHCISCGTHTKRRIKHFESSFRLSPNNNKSKKQRESWGKWRAKGQGHSQSSWACLSKFIYRCVKLFSFLLRNQSVCTIVTLWMPPNAPEDPRKPPSGHQEYLCVCVYLIFPRLFTFLFNAK